MPAMDYIFADPVSHPLDERHHYSETIIDLPCVVHLNSYTNYPAVGVSPARRYGVITFGAFNRMEKYNDEVYATWAEILKRVPNSMILFKAPPLDDPKHVKTLLAIFHGHGILTDRIMTMGRTSHVDHLAAHNLVDIMLEPFPHNGGVTVLELLRMGVPVITLDGHSPFRVVPSLLEILNLQSWIAKNTEEYVEIAVKYAADPDYLDNLRSELRERFDNSVLGNSPLYVSKVEALYRLLWQSWCTTVTT